MRLAWKIVGVTLCVWGTCQGLARGQAIPAMPIAPPVAAPAAAVATPATPATPAGFNLWTALCPPPGFCDKCRDRYCKSMVGQMVGAIFRPMRLLSGGLMQGC